VTRAMEAAQDSGLAVKDLAASRITGLEGNREFFLLMRPGGTTTADIEGLHQRARKVCTRE